MLVKARWYSKLASVTKTVSFTYYMKVFRHSDDNEFKMICNVN